MDSKNLFFLKFMLRFTHRRYIMIASHKLKRYQGKGIKIPLRTVAASFYIFWPGAYPVKRSGNAGDILYTYVCRYKALNHSFRYLCWFCGVLSSGSRASAPSPSAQAYIIEPSFVRLPFAMRFHSKPRNNSFTMKISKTIRFCAFLLKFYRFCVVFF